MLSKDELLRLVETDVDEFNLKLRDAGSDGADLSEVDFSNMIISGANFTNANLNSASFADSTLSEVDFTNCDLTSADFTRVNCVECNFSEALLNGADFSYGRLDYCNFSEADMAGVILNESDLTNSDLSCAYNLNACRFDDETIWPEAELLPDDFDSVYSDDLSSLRDEDDYNQQQDY